MKKLIVVLISLMVLGIVYCESNWVTDFTTCPQTYQSQTCILPTLVCGYSGGITYCANPASITAPGSTASSNTDQDGGSYNGGYLIDCYAYDGSTPFCNNGGSFWCDRNSTCYTTKHRDTTCTASVFGMSSCGGCRSGYADCSGDDDCETQLGVSNCAVGSNNNVPSCGNCVCDSGAYDCDAGGAGVGNGCEILNGASCSIGGLTGTYSGCSGSVGNCVVPTSYFITGNRANYSTTQPLLWGKNYGLGWLLNFSNSSDSIWGVNQYGCISFPDTTTQCTASTGGYSYDQIATNIGNYSAERTAIYTNYTTLRNNVSTLGNWTLDKPSYLPYMGANKNLTMGTNNITASNYSITGQSGAIVANSTCMRIMFNSSMWFGIGGAC